MEWMIINCAKQHGEWMIIYFLEGYLQFFKILQVTISDSDRMDDYKLFHKLCETTTTKKIWISLQGGSKVQFQTSSV